MRAKSIVVIPFLVLFFFGCNNNPDSVDDNPSQETILAEKPSRVKVFNLEYASFNKELLANGKVDAVRKTNLRFLNDGIIMSVNVKESERVSTGQIIAKLEDSQQKRALKQSMLRYRQAVLDYEDQLLRLGYTLSDTAKLDKKIINVAKLRSGLSSAELEKQRSESDLSYTNMIAPFSGKIANVKAKTFSGSSSFEYVCSLIEDSQMVVEFLILQQELDFIKISKNIKIVPFANTGHSYSGVIESINPIIDKAGMISIKARVFNRDGWLIDGMSVRVISQNEIPHQLVVPKNAVLERQGRKVVFTAKGNKASWNYVNIAYENSMGYAIGSGLKQGDKVIIEGNFNLAHDKSIVIGR